MMLTCLGIWEAYRLDQVGDEIDRAPEFDQGNIVLKRAMRQVLRLRDNI